jgi:arylsulfatase
MIQPRLPVFALALLFLSTLAQAEDKPNVLVIWGDDIGYWNISHNNRGMMGYETPNIDRIANEVRANSIWYDQGWLAWRKRRLAGS